MSEDGKIEFSWIRALLWPIHRFELKKFFPIFVLFFLISFDYNVLRTLKDTLIVTPLRSGAEVIPFIKVWILLPASLLMTLLFTRLLNRFTFEKVFYIMLSLFLVYFGLFTFVAYPFGESIHLHSLADSLEIYLPVGFKGLIAMIRYWSFTTFYVMSELWSNIVLSLLFWGFANQVTKIHEAKRFYGILGVSINFSGIVAGYLSTFCFRLDYNPALPGTCAWDQTLYSLVTMVLFAGVGIFLLFRWIHAHVLTDPRFRPEEDEELTKKEKPRMSMRENFRTLMQSRYLFAIALINLAYNLIINLVEVMWKHEVKALYPDPIEFGLYMNQVMIAIGVCATLTSLFLTGNIIRKFGWTFTAMLTPVVLFATSIGFFAFFFLKQTPLTSTILGLSPLAMSVFFGTLQNCLSRGAKYTVFDATREMALVPLDQQTKIKGKAAIDGVCSRLGKSGGSVIHQGLLVTFGTITASAPYVAAFLLTTLVIWFGAVRSVGRKFDVISATPSIDPDTIYPEQKTKSVPQEAV